MLKRKKKFYGAAANYLFKDYWPITECDSHIVLSSWIPVEKVSFYFISFLEMSLQINHIKELEVVLKTEKPSKIRTFDKLIFGNISDRKNRQRIREFTSFPFEIHSTE